MKRNVSITNLIIIINVVVFLYATFIYSGGLANYNLRFGIWSNEIDVSGTVAPVISYITGVFAHAGLLHILFNMGFLFYIGPLLESYIGKVGFIVYYMLVALVSGFILSMFSKGVTVGASGIIFSILTTLIILGYYEAPRFVINIRPLFNLLLINVIFTFVGSGVSIVGHLSGIICGIIAGLIILQVKT